MINGFVCNLQNVDEKIKNILQLLSKVKERKVFKFFLLAPFLSGLKQFIGRYSLVVFNILVRNIYSLGIIKSHFERKHNICL